MNLFSCFFITIAIAGCSRKIPAEASSLPSPDSTAVVVSSAPAQRTPICIAEKIEAIKKEPVWNPPAEIYEYEYEGKKVYVISADCCDRFTTVVDATCKYLCAPSGGFTGRGDGKCLEFFKHAKQIRLVWKDKRVRK